MGGVLTSHRQLTSRLREEGLEVSYVDTGSVSRAVAAIPRLWRRRALHLFHITRVWRAVMMAPLFAVLPGRTVLVLHSGSVSRQVADLGRLRRWLLARALGAYDEIWAVNEGIGRQLAPRLRSRVRVVTPFVPPSTPPAPSRRRAAHRLSVSTNAGLPHYNADLAVESVRLVRQKWPDATLRVLAYGHAGEGLARLRSLVSSEPWVEVSFDATPAEVHDVLGTSAVFLRPTSWDGDSVIVREALAAGCRVVASDVAPRPAGVELCELTAEAVARAVLHGAPVSDGTDLVSATMVDAAMAALAGQAPG